MLLLYNSLIIDLPRTGKNNSQNNIHFRSQVLKIVRSHNVEEVTIAVERFQANNIGRFFLA